MSKDEAIVRIVARGRVHGVGYRAWAAHKAERLGLAGFVRNRSDGSVEALFAGPADAVETMVDMCHRGPLGGRVYALERTEAAASDLPHRRAGEASGADAFVILPDL